MSVYNSGSGHFSPPVLKTYLPILVFAFLGLTVGGTFAMLNHLLGPKKPARPTAASRRQGEPYESGIPVEPAKGLRDADSFFVLGELITFVVLLLVAFVYVWRKGALDWR